MHLHIGLGNPGNSYKCNRHNIGFMVIDALMEFYGVTSVKEKFNSILGSSSLPSGKILFLKPQTYMNNSGKAVFDIVNYFSIPLSSIIVWHDDIDISQGKVRIKVGGGNGGHNGIRDIDSHIGREYFRVRIGVGRPSQDVETSNWVLSSFKKEDYDNWLNSLLLILTKESTKLHANDLAGFMNSVSSKQFENNNN